MMADFVSIGIGTFMTREHWPSFLRRLRQNLLTSFTLTLISVRVIKFGYFQQLKLFTEPTMPGGTKWYVLTFIMCTILAQVSCRERNIPVCRVLFPFVESFAYYYPDSSLQ